MDIDEWRASVFGALSPVAITLLPLHRFGINLLDLFPYGSFRDGLYANMERARVVLNFFRSAFIMQYKFRYTRYKYQYPDSAQYSDLKFLLLEFSVRIFHDWSLFLPGISYIGAGNIF